MLASSRDTSYESAPPYVISDKAKLANMEKSEGNFVYNSKTREFFGRTFSEWSVAIYGIFFAAIVGAFFGMCIWVFYQTLDNYTPKLQTTSSFIGANPGLGYRPMRQVRFLAHHSVLWKTKSFIMSHLKIFRKNSTYASTYL